MHDVRWFSTLSQHLPAWQSIALPTFLAAGLLAAVSFLNPPRALAPPCQSVLTSLHDSFVRPIRVDVPLDAFQSFPTLIARLPTPYVAFPGFPTLSGAFCPTLSDACQHICFPVCFPRLSDALHAPCALGDRNLSH